jgi:hypothetical protein
MMMTIRQPGGFSFACSLDIATIRHKLKSIFPSWKWTGHDSDTYGIYIIGRPPTSDAHHKVRIFCDGPHAHRPLVGPERPDQLRYVLDFSYDYGALQRGKTADHLIPFAKDQLLPAIGATDVKEEIGSFK